MELTEIGKEPQKDPVNLPEERTEVEKEKKERYKIEKGESALITAFSPEAHPKSMALVVREEKGLVVYFFDKNNIQIDTKEKLGKEGQTLGRFAGKADVTFKGEGFSRDHLTISSEEGVLLIEDSSTNGTFIENMGDSIIYFADHYVDRTVERYDARQLKTLPFLDMLAKTMKDVEDKSAKTDASKSLKEKIVDLYLDVMLKEKRLSEEELFYLTFKFQEGRWGERGNIEETIYLDKKGRETLQDSVENAPESPAGIKTVLSKVGVGSKSSVQTRRELSKEDAFQIALMMFDKFSEDGDRQREIAQGELQVAMSNVVKDPDFEYWKRAKAPY